MQGDDDHPPREVDHRGDGPGRWRDIDYLLLRPGRFAGPGFEPGEDVKTLLHDHVKLLVVGAGGLGCELLKDLGLSGFKDIHVIDMDTIDVSNLNRQFLFRDQDVGKSKAICAAEAIERRISGCKVTPHHCRIEDKPDEWYQQFHVLVMGLDSIEARSYLNAVACGFLEFDENDEVIRETIKPMVDGGTEGFKGHARVIYPGITPCFECTRWLFPPQKGFPLCTIAETPRCAAHCVEYARLIQWGKERPNETFDGDVQEHVAWVYERAKIRAEAHEIEGVTYRHTLGVVKNIIPAIPSTNAIVAAACALEVFKMVTMAVKGMNNFMMYNGREGVYTHTVAYEKDDECPACSPGVRVEFSRDVALGDVVDACVKKFPNQCEKPSVSSATAGHLYMRGVFEEETRANLGKKLVDLVPDDADDDAGAGTAAEDGTARRIDLEVNDKKMKRSLRLRVFLK